MRRTLFLAFAAITFVAIVTGAPLTALAAGTTANTTVDNTAVVSWNAGATAYSTTNTASFLVDRLVTFSVTNQTAAGLTVDVFPGDPGGVGVNVLAFDVANASNTTVDFGLSAVNTGATVTSALPIYWDDDGNGIYDGTEPIAATLNDVPADSTSRVFIVADIDSAAAAAAVENIDLLAQAQDYTSGVAFTNDSGTAWAALTLQNVLYDAAGTEATDVANDGQHSDRGYYRVVVPTLTVTKAINAVADTRAFNSTNAKAIPGATVRYTITIQNTGTGAATGVTVVDSIPAGTAYMSGSLALNGTPDADDTSAPGDYNVTNSGAITMPLGAPLAPATSATVGFTVQIQ